ncbi:hypothetical protein HMI56_005531, partial [Coelomomyces lativittatus]
MSDTSCFDVNLSNFQLARQLVNRYSFLDASYVESLISFWVNHLLSDEEDKTIDSNSFRCIPYSDDSIDFT